MQENDSKLEGASVEAKNDEIFITPKVVASGLAEVKANNISAVVTAPAPVSAPAPIKEDVVTKKMNKKRANAEATGEMEEHIKLKRRKIKAAGAPKMPLNGYVRYMNDRRETLRKEYPDKSAIEHTRIIGEEWHKLTIDKRTPYMEAAELDRQRYHVELQEFLKTHPEVWADEIAKSKAQKTANAELASQQKDKSLNSSSKSKPTSTTLPNTNNNNNNNQSHNNSNSHNSKEDEGKVLQPTVAATNSSIISNEPTSVVVEKSVSPITFAGNYNETIINSNNNNGVNPFVQGEIPIFTNEFLEHNKVLDNELRALRKSKTDLEQQNAVLEKHVDNMKCGVKKLSVENNEWRDKIHTLEKYFEKLIDRLVKGLNGELNDPNLVSLTHDNIEKFVENLKNTNNHGSANFKAQEVIQKLDLQISLEK